MSEGMRLLRLRAQRASILYGTQIAAGSQFAQHVWHRQRQVKTAEDMVEKVCAELYLLDLLDAFTKPMLRTFDTTGLDTRKVP